MKLCTRLVAEDNPSELRPVAARLQFAIRERVERLRRNALQVALGEIVGRQPQAPQQGTKESAT